MHLLLLLHGICALQRRSNAGGPFVYMLLYAVAVLMLIQELADCDKWNQNWYAKCAAKLTRLRVLVW